jgi:RNA polymerase sigma factor (TIGR02999 family)
VADRVVAQLYRDLKRIAAREFRRERPAHTLQATALVNEAYLRLRQVHGVAWANRRQFLGFAAHLMRRILVDHARVKGTARRGAGGLRVPLAEAEAVGGAGIDLLALDGALEELARLDSRKAAVVELRFFGGLTLEEIAAALGLSPETIGREWRRARAWLYQALAPRGEAAHGT